MCVYIYTLLETEKVKQHQSLHCCFSNNITFAKRKVGNVMLVSD